MSKTKQRSWLKTAVLFCAAALGLSAYAETTAMTPTISGSVVTWSNEATTDFDNYKWTASGFANQTLNLPEDATSLPAGTRVSISTIALGACNGGSDNTPVYPEKLKITVDGLEYVSAAKTEDGTFTCATTGETSTKMVYSFAASAPVVKVGTDYAVVFLDADGKALATKVNFRVAKNYGSFLGPDTGTWAPVQELTGTIVYSATVDSNGNIGAYSPTPDASATKFWYDVPQTTTLALGTMTVGSAYFNVSSGATLTLTGSLTGNDVIRFFSEGTLDLSGATLTGTVDGLITAEGATAIDALPANAFGEGWTGTVWLKNRTGWSDFDPTAYGNAGSTLRFSGIQGHFANAKYGADTMPVIELKNDSYDYALNLNNGYSFNSNGGYPYVQTSELKGDGTLLCNGSGGALFIVKDKWSDFTGTLTMNNKTVWLGFDAPAETTENYNWGTVVGGVRIADGKEVTVTPNAGWTFGSKGGFIGGATATVKLLYPWQATSYIGTNARWTGTIELASYTTTDNVAINLANMGNAGSKIVLKGLVNNAESNHGPYIAPADGSTVNAEVVIEGAVTFGAANSGKTQTLNKITGSGNLNFFYTGSHSYYINDVSEYTGTIASMGSSTVYLGVPSTPEIGDLIAKVDSTNNKVSTSITVGSEGAKATGELNTVEEVYGLYVVAEATINDTSYATLASAIEAAEEGDTITLSSAVTEATITVDKNITIDGAASYQLNAASLNIAAGKTVTFTNFSSQNTIGAITGGGNIATSGNRTFRLKISGTNYTIGELALGTTQGIRVEGEGTLTVSKLTATASSTLDAFDGAQITIGEVDSDSDITVSLKLVNTVAMTKKGSGTLTFAGVAAPTAGFVVEGGSVIIDNSMDGISPYVWVDASDESTIIETDGKVTEWASRVNGHSYTNDASAMTYESAEGVFGGAKVVRTNSSQLQSEFTGDKVQSAVAAIRYYSNSGTGRILYGKNPNNNYIGKRNSKDGFWSCLRTSSTACSLWQNGGTSDVKFKTFETVLSVAAYYNNMATTEYLGGGSGDIAIAEFIGFNTTDTGCAVRKRTEAYLGNKWSISGMVSLPNSVPLTIAGGTTFGLAGLERTVDSVTITGTGAATITGGALTITAPVSVAAGQTLVIPYGSTYTLASDGTYAVEDSDGGTVTITHRAADIDGTLYDTVQGAVDAYESGTLTIYESAELSLTNALTIVGVVLENEAELTFADTVPFTSSYEEGTISCVRNVSTFVYVGPETFTVAAANFTVGGKAASVVPEATDTIQFDTAATIDMTAASYQFAAVVVNANVTLNGGGSHYLYSDAISGTGKLSLEDGARLATYSGQGTISCELEVNASSSNPAYLYVADSGREITLTGALSGSGYLKCTRLKNASGYSGCTFHCSDTTGFSGTIEMVHPGDVGRNHITFWPTCDLSGATVIVGNYSGGRGRIIDGQSNDAVYKFGSFSGYVSPNASNVGSNHPTIEIGALGKDDTVTGNWMPHPSRNPTIRKVGEGTLTTSAINAYGYILNGGTLVVKAGAEASVTTEVAGATVESAPTYDTENPETLLYTTYTLATYVAQIDGGDSFESLAEAVAAAEDGDTVTLLADLDLTSTVTIAKDVTLDLNGHNVASLNCRAILVESGTVAITGSGMVSATADANVNTSTFPTGSSVIKVGSNAAATSFTLGADVTVTSDYCYGITYFGTQPQTVVINGTVSVTGEQAAVSGNGRADFATSTVTVNGTVTATQDYAIYNPQAGTTAINGTVTGLGGVEVKGGTVTVGATAEITATGTPSYTQSNQDGTSTVGYAIASVGNSSYKQPAIVNVEDGATVTGTVIIIKENKSETYGTVNSAVNTLTIPEGFEWSVVENGYTLAVVTESEIDPASDAGTPVEVDTTKTPEEQAEEANTAAQSLKVTKTTAAAAVDDTTWDGYFTKYAEKDNGGNWVAKAKLNEAVVLAAGVVEEQEVSVEEQVFAAVMSSTATEATIPAKPGLYYAIEAANNLGFTGAAPVTPKLAEGATVTLDKPNVSNLTGNAVFYRVKVTVE